MAKKISTKPTPQNPADDTRRNRLKTRRDIAALDERLTALQVEVWRDTLRLEARVRALEAGLLTRVTALEEWRGRGNVRDNPEPVSNLATSHY